MPGAWQFRYMAGMNTERTGKPLVRGYPKDEVGI